MILIPDRRASPKHQKLMKEIYKLQLETSSEKEKQRIAILNTSYNPLYIIDELKERK